MEKLGPSSSSAAMRDGKKSIVTATPCIATSPLFHFVICSNSSKIVVCMVTHTISEETLHVTYSYDKLLEECFFFKCENAQFSMQSAGSTKMLKI